MVNKLVFDLSDLARRIDPLTSPEVRQIDIRVLKACSEPSSQPEPLLQADLRGDKITVKFIESLLENVAEVFCVGGGIPMRDQFKVLQEELVFIKGILMDPPEYFDTMSLSCLFMHIKLASIKTGIVVYSLGVSEMNVEITGKVYSSPLDFLEESMKLFKVKYMEIYLKSPFPKSPSTDELGFLDYFLGNLAELLNNQTDPSTRLNLPTKPLVEEFQFLRSFLSKIAKQHTEQENLNVLWEQIINVAYKTEYIVDSLLVGNGLIWPRMPWLSEIRKRIEVLKTEVNKIGEDTMYNSEVYSSAEISYQASLSATSPEIDEVVIGLKTEEESLLKHLVGRSSKLKMISIVGMPGLGKTHFSKRIYNNQIVKDYFDVCAWCFVSQVHNKKNLLMVILSQVAGPIEDISLKTDEELAELLYKSLKGNRYLIVMDDMWDIEAWDALQRSFPDDNNGSIIMFTTRYQNLNLKVSSDNKIYLRRFSDDESWQLLQEKLFSGETCPSELIEVGKEMAKNCDGLPLAVVLVAGILAKIDMQEPQWRKVASSLSSLIVGDPEKKSMKVIELSYNHLPGYLKSCFLYIGAFCKNKYIQVRKLVRLWVAEGFVHKVEPKSFEDTSKDYLMDLIGRSLIIITERGSRWDVKVCHVHVLVLDFCLEKAKDEFFLKPIEQLRISTSDLSRKIIHEQRRIRSSRPERFLSSKMYCPNLRSLLFSDASNSFGKANCDAISSIFGKFKLLKVLDLVCINVDGTFPDGINLLGHLRYLALCGSFVSIPPSIANLQNLLTLIVEAFPYQVLLPHTIWNMVKLRHLQISNCCFGSKQLRGHVSRLQNLQTLSNLELSYEEDTGELLEGLSNVKRLKCIFLHCNGLVELATLKKLESLTLTYQGKPWGPCEFSFPSSIKKLTLSVFRFPWNQISMIGKLPNLEVLKLLFEAFVGEEWEMEDGEFPKLRFLKLSGLDIRKWSVSSDHFPPLEQLVLESCRYLEEIPSSLAEIPTLKMIEAKWCNKSLDNVIKQIKEEQVDMGNQEFDGIIEHFVE